MRFGRFGVNGAGVVGVVALLCVVLVIGGASPVAAAERDGAHGTVPFVGGFAIGDRAEALIDERTGALVVDLSVGKATLRWSSRLGGVDRFGFGPGWGLSGVGFVDTVGGIRVFPARGGVLVADSSASSGLRGYVLDDLKFVRHSGTLSGRVDGVVGSRSYAFTLVELGGTTTYFNADGNPVSRVDGFGNRTDWVWKAAKRLSKVVNPLGVVTDLNWSVPGRVIVTSTGGSGDGKPISGVVELRNGQVAAGVAPGGERTVVAYDVAGRVAEVRGVSGVATDVSWQTLPDGTTAVDQVRVKQTSSGVVFSFRSWNPDAGFASGYPTYVNENELFASGDDDYRYATSVSDGPTTVVTEYNSQGLLIARNVSVTTQTGERVVQTHGFTYPGTESGGVPDPAHLPKQYNRPTKTSIVHHDLASSAQREEVEEYVFDPYGRATSRTTADGTVATTVYDETIPPEGELPIGLPLVETTTTRDGLIAEARYELNDARTAAKAIETFTGRTGDSELTRVGRVERDIAADGFVTAERRYEHGGAGAAVTTTWHRTVDLASSTVTVSETQAAGTELAVTTVEISDIVTGQPTIVTDAAGNTTTIRYDAIGRPIAHIAPDGNTTTTEYRTQLQHGINASVVTAPNGVVTTEEQDALGRVTRITDNLALADSTAAAAPVKDHSRLVESRSYPQPGVVTVTDAWGAVTTTRQDVFGREVESTAPNGLTKITRHDDVANTVSTGLTPTGNLQDAELVTTNALNANGDIIHSSGQRTDGAPVLAIATEYDGFGRTVHVADGKLKTNIEFDTTGNPVTTTLTPSDVADSAATSTDAVVASRRFDQHGASIEKTLSSGNQSRSGGTRELDVLGRVVSETDQLGNTTTYTYTRDGLVATVKTAHGTVTTNKYHPVTRRLAETRTESPIGAPVHRQFAHDPKTGAVVAVWDPADRVGTEITYTYDHHGNTTATTYPDGTTIRQEYDVHGRKTATTDAAGNLTRYQYDPSGLIIAATQTTADGKPIVSVGYEYDHHGRLATLTRGNGVTTKYTFTATNHIATETTTAPDGHTQSHRTYTYDATGNLTQRIDRVDHPDAETSVARTTSYVYDAHDRLVSSTIHAGETPDTVALQRTDYSLTVSDDIDTETVTTNPETADAQSTIRKFSYTATGHLTHITTTRSGSSTTTAEQAYDAAGNLVTAADGTRYTYNAANKIVTETAPGGDVIRTEYWATGQRASLSHDNTTTTFHWDDTILINETHTTEASSPQVVSYLLGGTRHARTTRDGSTYYVHDRHGNVTELSDDTGKTTNHYTYTDYGATATMGTATAAKVRVGDTGYQPFQYAGEYTNPTPAHTQWLHTRLFDPDTMRFTTMDVEKLHNRFNFADLNPITMIDPSGRFAEFDGDHYVVQGLSVALAFIGVIAALMFTGGVTIPAAVAVGTALGSAGVTTAQVLSDTTALPIDDTILGATGIALALVGAVAGVAAVGHAIYAGFKGRAVTHLLGGSVDADVRTTAAPYRRWIEKYENIPAHNQQARDTFLFENQDSIRIEWMRFSSIKDKLDKLPPNTFFHVRKTFDKPVPTSESMPSHIVRGEIWGSDRNGFAKYKVFEDPKYKLEIVRGETTTSDASTLTRTLAIPEPSADLPPLTVARLTYTIGPQPPSDRVQALLDQVTVTTQY